MKRKASDALYEIPTQIIKREIAISGISDVMNTDDMNRFRKNLNAAKLRKIQKLHTTVLELHECVRTYSLKTTTGENSVLHYDEESNVIIFTCQHNLDALQHVTTVFVDKINCLNSDKYYITTNCKYDKTIKSISNISMGNL